MSVFSKREKYVEHPLIISLAVNGILFLIFAVIFHPTYGMIDDVRMLLTLLGYYGQQHSAFIVFVNAIFSVPLSRLFASWPGVNWYSLLLYGAHFAGMTALLYSFLKPKVKWQGLMLFLFLFTAFEMPFLLHLTFTTAAFILAQGGVFLAISDPEEPKQKSQLLFAALLLIGAALVREESFYLGLVLSLPLITMHLIEKRSLKQPMFFALVIFVVMAANIYHQHYYVQNGHRWAFEANRVRSEMNDRPGIKYDRQSVGVIKKYGLSENDVILYRSWFLAGKNIYASKRIDGLRRSFPALRAWPAVMAHLREALRADWRPIIFTGCAVLLSLLLLGPGKLKLELFYLGWVGLICVELALSFKLPSRVFVPQLFFISALFALSLDRQYSWREAAGKTWQRRASLIVLSVALLAALLQVIMINIRNEKSIDNYRSTIKILSAYKVKIFVNWEVLCLQYSNTFSTLTELRELKILNWGREGQFKQWAGRPPYGSDLCQELYENNIMLLITYPDNIPLLQQFIKEHYKKSVIFQPIAELGQLLGQNAVLYRARKMI